MKIRHALLSEIDIIMNVYAFARQIMQDSGNKNQWINGYPAEVQIRNDIDEHNCYVYMDENNEIAGAFYFRQGEDITYSKIYDGAWLNNEPYGVVHRLAARSAGKGIASYILEWCLKQCSNLRIDTHQDNLIMQHILQKNGYTPCGTIRIRDGSKRIVYQKCRQYK